MNFLKKVGHFFLDIIQTVTLALSIFVVVYLFLFQPHQVRGQSMYPNFSNQDFLLTDKITYRFHQPQRGDVIVFKAPSSEPCAEIECEYIKRIVGLPGEEIMIKDNQVWINGKILTESYLPADYQTQPGHYLKEGQSYQIPPDTYIVLGDNRDHSRDSREFGPVNHIIGLARFRYWPPARAGLVTPLGS